MGVLIVDSRKRGRESTPDRRGGVVETRPPVVSRTAAPAAR